MSVKRYCLDTNILIYSIDKQAGERHEKARHLMQEMMLDDCVMTLQSLGEFFHAATRKGKISSQEAMAQVHDWMILFPVINAVPTTLRMAMHSVDEHQFSFWDAMILETAVQAGVTHLYSEDMQHKQSWKNMLIENPFISDF